MNMRGKTQRFACKLQRLIVFTFGLDLIVLDKKLGIKGKKKQSVKSGCTLFFISI